MHPALSVIFFTTASGAGYGMLSVLGLGFLLGIIPDKTVFVLSSIAVALGLISCGLVSSTFHLGRPERAWRALSQWRSSWLSREGVLACLSYVPVLIFAAGWYYSGQNGSLLFTAALFMSISCLLTVYATSMIYASLKTVHAWCNHWVPATYLVLSFMTGAILLNTLALIFSCAQAWLNYAALVFISIALLIKLAYWNYIKTTRSVSTAESATGLGDLGKVNLTQTPHSQENYLLKEMGYQIARKHADKLRRISIISGFVLPFLFALLAMKYSGISIIVLSVIALLSCAVGILTERWLFFAEAKHTVMLYYGSSRV
ncbi:MAG: dimethyl sulfoxide reductase anchor subunit [Gammaproteobacteria bacterium]|nr:dimethyl sulfoxide reductase anchor subunit [Gammaproteobacteria bacterium]